MAKYIDSDSTQLAERLSKGFAALLEQVDELKRHSEAMEKLLGSERNAPSVHLETEQKARELAILDGVEACEALKCKDGNTAQDAKSFVADINPQKYTMPQGHPAIDYNGSKTLSCPFAVKSQITDQQPFEPSSPLSHRPDPPPTPPDTGDRYTIDRVKSSELPPPAPASVTGSFSKCPIRLLDERPPEEIAEYFETHKHEIPRSHEVCVKRYQSNEQSIRQLDAKYGNLVNMIQGLGLKHQALLPHKDEEAEDEVGTVEKEAGTRPGGGSKVEDWVRGVRTRPEECDTVEFDATDIRSEREGHFDRPLKEIRVGESPSRPWGISVPIKAATQEDSTPSDRVRPESKPKSIRAEPSSFDLRNIEGANIGSAKPSTANVVFNGPVFIGYPPEQAAAFLKQFGAQT